MESLDAGQGVGPLPHKRRHLRDVVFGLLLTGFAFVWLALVAVAWAEAVDTKSNAQADRDEYDFSWLDPEKKIYVLQNRKYTKAGHPVISFLGGTGFSDPFRDSYNLDPRVSFYASETWGIELFYTQTFNFENNHYAALAESSGQGSGKPSIREIRSRFGAMVHYVPWYAKINVFNSILYFDWYFGAGLGSVKTYVDTNRVWGQPTQYVNQDLLGLFFSTGHQYHLSQHLLFRIDVTGTFYQAATNGLTGGTAWYSNYNFGVGLGWRI